MHRYYEQQYHTVTAYARLNKSYYAHTYRTDVYRDRARALVYTQYKYRRLVMNIVLQTVAVHVVLLILDVAQPSSCNWRP